MIDYGIIKRYKKGVFMDISEIRQKIDANRRKISASSGGLFDSRVQRKRLPSWKQDDRTDFWNDNDRGPKKRRKN